MNQINLGVICAALTLLNCLVSLSAAAWVNSDAKTLGIQKSPKQKGQKTGFFDMSAAMWAISCFLLWIVALPAYLARRAQHKQVSTL